MGFWTDREKQQMTKIVDGFVALSSESESSQQSSTESSATTMFHAEHEYKTPSGKYAAQRAWEAKNRDTVRQKNTERQRRRREAKRSATLESTKHG